MLRYIRRNPPKTEYGRILCFDNQECFTFLDILDTVHFEHLYNMCITVHLYTKCKTVKEYCFKGYQE